MRREAITVTIPWQFPPLPRMKAYILAPGIVQIEDVIYNLPKRTEEHSQPPPAHYEFIMPVKTNSMQAARAAMEGLYRIVFD
ncbi:MAG: hypothetical protein EHJ95_01170 [Methanobacteriota archaeon]|nr:MAG: hypothetical protein EHJ95_01170 [Euryarchaeota archaeon]